jgi:hypothetical protein
MKDKRADLSKSRGETEKYRRTKTPENRDASNEGTTEHTVKDFEKTSIRVFSSAARLTIKSPLHPRSERSLHAS